MHNFKSKLLNILLSKEENRKKFAKFFYLI